MSSLLELAGGEFPMEEAFLVHQLDLYHRKRAPVNVIFLW